ncbi:helix-turn-helix domain-containing protein [Candidatus Vondammii sp. HM_W22]|uniref:helix-turn-helix domain-containing protein n=1 Tax=Candidatus Vondammii sp. HM_W22 TaxID=2687299 RepID=UPI001F12EE37|nr:helix-turn-helix domain-containing protein [Candidatus Vondammii sp. HM_W22]
MPNEEHGVVTVSVSWAKLGSGFTAMFEALVIDWLKEASISAVSRLMGLSWNAIDGIMQRAVKRGLARRKKSAQHVLLLMRLPSRNATIM